MQISGLWRYPVKSLGGEPLREAELTRDGIVGDRVVQVRGRRGLLTGRTRSGLLTVPAATGPKGVPWVDGHPWYGDDAQEVVRARAGDDDAYLVASPAAERFDILNLLVATDGEVNRFGGDIRRLRPNILVGGVPPGAERDWPGQALAVGEALVGIHSVRQRCIVTTIDPDSGEQDLDVLRRIRALFGNELCLNCWVIEPGTIREGDRVALVPAGSVPTRSGRAF